MNEQVPPESEGRVVLVDPHGRPIGSAPKLHVHRAPGIPHLAFSLVVFRPGGTLLLQRRATSKYHFAGRWSNSCCSHPAPGESPFEAAERRAGEELGISLRDLRRVSSFWYCAQDAASGLVEHEFDIVFTAVTEDLVDPDPAEVAETTWVSLAEARAWCRRIPDQVTPWLHQVLQGIPASSHAGSELPR